NIRTLTIYTLTMPYYSIKLTIFLTSRPPPISPLFPYTTLFRSRFTSRRLCAYEWNRERSPGTQHGNRTRVLSRAPSRGAGAGGARVDAGRVLVQPTGRPRRRRYGARPERLLDSAAAARPARHDPGDSLPLPLPSSRPRPAGPGAHAHGHRRHRAAQQQRDRRRLGGRARRGCDLRRRAGTVLPERLSGGHRHHGEDRRDRGSRVGAAAAVRT